MGLKRHIHRSSLLIRGCVHVGNAVFTRQPRHGVGSEDSRGLVPCVHNADAELLAGHQYGGDVATDKREDILDVVRTQHLSNALPAVARALGLGLAGKKNRVMMNVIQTTEDRFRDTQNILLAALPLQPDPL